MLQKIITQSGRKKRLLQKLNKIQSRIQRKLDNGSFADMTRKEQVELLTPLRRYALQLKRYGHILKMGMKGSALALALALTMHSPTANAQISFAEQTGTDNVLDGESGFYGTPKFVDIDNDGDFDIFSGWRFNVDFFLNTGTSTTPTYVKQTGANDLFNGILSGQFHGPGFADLDNDGDFDALVGNLGGAFNYYENTGTASAPAFTQQTGSNNPLDGVNEGGFSRIDLVDIDADGDFDAFIGTQPGVIFYFENTGTSSAPVFTQQTGANNPFDGESFDKYAIPAFVDLDEDGDLDAYVGESKSVFGASIRYYENTGTNTAPVFAERTGSNNPFDSFSGTGKPRAADFADIDGDGDEDLIQGGSLSVYYYYKNTSVLLPVELVDFKATKKRTSSLLHWQTASETNNAGFEVERSHNGEYWQNLGFVNGVGTSQAKQDYQFIDQRPLNGINYYRLKQIDFDGKFEYSDIQSVHFQNGQNTPVQVFPNPLKDGNLTVKLDQCDDQEITIQIYDLTGKIWLQRTSYETVTELNVQDLTAGVYFLQINANGQTARQKIVIE